MAKYINADELLQKSENVYYQYDTQHSPLDSSVCRGISLVEQMIINQPAADVEPVRHGEWKYQPPTATLNGAWKCTACKCYFWEHTANEFKYCPNCGAKMDGE